MLPKAAAPFQSFQMIVRQCFIPIEPYVESYIRFGYYKCIENYPDLEVPPPRTRGIRETARPVPHDSADVCSPALSATAYG